MVSNSTKQLTFKKPPFVSFGLVSQKNIHNCLKRLLKFPFPPCICVLDFQDVTFMDSSGIAVVINTLRNMTRIKGKLTLIGIREQPMRVFAASGIDKLVEIKEVAV